MISEPATPEVSTRIDTITYACECGAPALAQGARCLDCLSAAIEKIGEQMEATRQEWQAREEAEAEKRNPPPVEVVEVRSMNRVEARAAFRSINPEALEYFRARLMGTMDRLLVAAPPVEADILRDLINSFLSQKTEAQPS